MLRLLRLLVEVTFVAHLVACVWHALPMLEEEGHSWFETPGAQIHDDTSTRNRYLKALCKTTSTTALACKSTFAATTPAFVAFHAF